MRGDRVVVAALLALTLACGRKETPTAQAPPIPPARTSGAATGRVVLNPSFVLAPDVHPEQERRISIDELRPRLERGEVVMLDVRPAHGFARGHATGAINIPFDQVAARAGEIPRGKLVVAYCLCPHEDTSARAVIDLRKAGFDAAALRGGLDAWVAAKLPVTRPKA